MSTYSSVRDLTQLGKDIGEVFEKHGFGAPAFAVVFTLPPDYSMVHWVTNLLRSDGIQILKKTVVAMTAQNNQKTGGVG